MALLATLESDWASAKAKADAFLSDAEIFVSGFEKKAADLVRRLEAAAGLVSSATAAPSTSAAATVVTKAEIPAPTPTVTSGAVPAVPPVAAAS
ncbi:MAG: hypothetical protein PF483_05830 [Halothiobacillus sp.]|jgi:hypothetical protein|nr:hypothetical protein [Halothiobacillus sp.]